MTKKPSSLHGRGLGCRLPSRRSQVMRYATAVRRLRTIAEDCQRLASVFDGDDGPLAAYAFGPMLDAPGEAQDVLHLALVMGMPAAEPPWGVEPPGCTSLASWLQLDKAPMLRRWRPHEWPVSNHEIRRPLPVWTRGDGVQTAALDALAKLDAEPYRLAEPDQAARAPQTAPELAPSSTHLRQVRDRHLDDP